jgi:hypothetical protein
VTPDALIPLPSCPPGDLSGGIRRWITSPPLRELVRAFGDRLPDGSTPDLLAWLDDFSEIYWDFRRGRLERHMVEPQDFGTPLTAQIEDTAAALGLIGGRKPSATTYSHLLVLGGLGATCLQRAAYAARLLHSGGIGSPRVAGLGSFRPLHDVELATPQLAGCAYEVDAMEAGIRDSFGLAAPSEHRGTSGPVTHESWSITTFEAPDGPTVQLMAAPSAEPARRRADTSDTYGFWADENHPGPEDNVLIVTSPIYVPFQHADAIRLLGLPYGCGVDTVGFEPSRLDVPLPDPGPARYLQEIRSAVRSLRRLHEAWRSRDA